MCFKDSLLINGRIPHQNFSTHPYYRTPYLEIKSLYPTMHGSTATISGSTSREISGSFPAQLVTNSSDSIYVQRETTLPCLNYQRIYEMNKSSAASWRDYLAQFTVKDLVFYLIWKNWTIPASNKFQIARCHNSRQVGRCASSKLSFLCFLRFALDTHNVPN